MTAPVTEAQPATQPVAVAQPAAQPTPAPQQTAQTAPVMEDGLPKHAAEDEIPVLSGAVETVAVEKMDGVNTETIPPFIDFSRALPSKRLRVQDSAAQIAQGLEGFQAMENMTEEEVMKSGAFRVVADVFSQMEVFVLNNAADEEAMVDWIVAQEDQNNALLYAFQTLLELVKK